jgi:proline racemase
MDFRVECDAETRVGERQAVLMRVTGKAYMTDEDSFMLDGSNLLPQGFLIR